MNRTKSRLRIMTLLTVVLSFFIHDALAGEEPVNIRDLCRDMSGKFGRGIVNAATGWGEMIRCPIEVTRERGRFLGCTWGPMKGVGMTFFRTLGGVFETALFFFPLPEHYAPFFESEFVWSKPVKTAPPRVIKSVEG